MAVALDLGNYGAISDYSGLVTQAKLWLDRGSELDGLIPSFVALAEGYLNRTLRTPEMENIAAPTMVDGVFPLPADFLAMRGLTVGGRPLDAVSPALLADTYGALAGYSRAYAISGRQVRVAPYSSDPVSLSYWQRIPALNLNQPNNWLLDGHSDIYLYGTLLSAETYIDNPDRVAQWRAAFEGAVEQLVEASNKARWGGPIVARPGVLRVRGAVT